MNQGNMTPLKELNKAPVAEPKEMDIYDLPDKKIQNNNLKEA